MQLFLLLNDLAGRWPLLDGVARFYYVAALPALGTLLLAQLLLLPRSGTGVSRSKTALALVMALVLGALLVWGFDLVAGWLHLGNLSPRPWMTRRVNWLVVEPQDNSFPCIELVLAAALACASLKLNTRLGIASWAGVGLLALTRLFCGNNYFADVLVGMALGASSFLVCSHLCQRHLPFGQRAREFSLQASPLAVTLAGCYCFALLSPRFEGKLGVGHPAVASTPPVVTETRASAASTSVTQGEGEGMEAEAGSAEELALAKRSTLFLPQLEAFLRGRLTPLARPFPLLDVEAAPVKAGSTAYRCAAIRFEVPAEQPNMRRLVVDRAARLVKTAFALDSNLQNVDIIAVARDEGRNLDGSLLSFAGDEVPVFTASIQRKNLIVASPAWLNAPGVDAGSWLRARSRIYINERALPETSKPTSALMPAPATNTVPNTGGTPLALPPATPLAAPSPAQTGGAQPGASAIPKATTPRATPGAFTSPLPLSRSTTPRPQTTVRTMGTPQATGARPTGSPTPTRASTAAGVTPSPTPARTAVGSSARP